MQSSIRGLVGMVSAQMSPGGGNSPRGKNEDWGIAAASANATIHGWSISNCSQCLQNPKGVYVHRVKKKSPLTRVRSRP